ncbi:MAG: peptidylprolyl isomerase [Pseudooceanicola sp.]|jgi:peptidyl-prolyl cis-trans isomerase C|nr:peptidylprolyl isomerase [Pseudooceanicola sp.]
MPKGLTFATTLAFAAVMALPQLAIAEPDADTVVARVNNQDITLGHVIVATATLPQQYRQLPPDVLYNAVVDQLIQQTALSDAYQGNPPRHVQLSLDNERRSLIAAAEIENIMADAVTDADIKAAYDAKYADGFGGDEFNASHILVETEDEAKAIKDELDSGADFATVAKEKSTGPSGPNGGELGWFGMGAMVPEFETAVVSLEPETVSDPVQTQFGWHVIRLNEKRKSEAPALAEVEGQLGEELRKQAVQDRVELLTREATIERPEVEGLSPEIINNLDLIRN